MSDSRNSRARRSFSLKDGASKAAFWPFTTESRRLGQSTRGHTHERVSASAA